jgi:hypothetical protein
VTSGEFWRLTPREYCLLADRWQESQEAAMRRAAMICATIANANRGPGSRAITIDDFMPTKPTAGLVSFDQVSAAMRALGGEEAAGEN